MLNAQEPLLSVIIPASNEAGWIGDCLRAVYGSTGLAGPAEVIVIANGCKDATAEVAASVPPPPGWRREVISLAQGSKPAALNRGDAAAQAAIRVYLDADCRISPPVLAELYSTLSAEAPRYAGATPRIPKAKSLISRAYAGFWLELPFNRTTAPGYGLFAVNKAGRARWGEFPQIISDDSFVRLQFAPAERHQVAGHYDWPVAEGFAALLRTRRRQNRGLSELASLWPGLGAGEGKTRLKGAELAKLALRRPLGFLAYAAVTLTLRLMPDRDQGFTRGR